MDPFVRQEIAQWQRMPIFRAALLSVLGWRARYQYHVLTVRHHPVRAYGREKAFLEVCPLQGMREDLRSGQEGTRLA